MEVHRQSCQACGSRSARNIIVRDAGKPMMIYVRCANCGELVARYELSGYYHHGKGLESYLKSRGVDASESGRQWLAQFNEVSEQAAVGYRDALEELQKAGKSLD